MIGGHGNATVLNLAGSADAAPVVDALGTSGTAAPPPPADVIPS